MVRGEPVGWYSPTYKLLNDAWREAKLLWYSAIASKNEQEKRIELVTGGSIEFWSLEDPDASRGRMYAQAFIDEAAHARHLQYAWENVISAALLDYGGGAWFFSTPNGKNYFYKLFTRGKDPDTFPDWACWQFPTSANPFIEPEYIEQRKNELPEQVFAQEHLAEFLEGEGAVFRNIQACINAPESTKGEHKGHDLYIGVDWGQKNDFTVCSVGCGTCKQEVALYRSKGLDYALERAKIAELYSHWKCKGGLVELNAMGQPNFEELQRAGVKVSGFDTTASSKPPLIENMILALEKEEWQFLDNPAATAELEAYERTVNPHTQRSKYGAPEGMHDDTVIGRALMLRAAGSSRFIF